MESVRVRLSRFLYDMCGGTDPVSLVDAQMSLPFTVAAAAVHGRLGPAQLDEAGRADPSVRLLMSRIVLVVDDRLHGSAPPILEVRTRDGTTQMVHAGEPLGSLANPMTTESVTAKFAELAGTALSPRRAAKLRDTVSRLDEISDAAVLLECLTC
jgi:2-methylcitrate dehydratase PrpD